MDVHQDSNRRTTAVCMLLAVLATSILPRLADAQIRTKKPDRGVYQPPLMDPSDDAGDSQFDRLRPAPKPKWGNDLVDAEILEMSPGVEQRSASRNQIRQSQYEASINDSAPMPPVLKSADQIASESGIIDQGVGQDSRMFRGEIIHEGPVLSAPGQSHFEPTPLEIGAYEGGCDSPGCNLCSMGDSGCDSIACGRKGIPKSNAFLSFSRDRWFGSIDLMLMFRRGDRPPALVTTGPDDNPDTAGELTQNDTQILVGGDSIFKDRTAGARLTLGTWLDNQQCRSLVFRGWFAGEKTFGFARNQDTLPVIVRPFLNVTDGQAETQDTQIVAFPNRATGSITVHGDSNVYGGDLSVRQFWYGNSGIEIDVLYGYQYMRFDENLSIRSQSVSLDDDFAPLGSTLAISDVFDIENEFHGGQLGVTSMMHYGCWSFSSLAKIAFGSLGRRANLSGQTATSIDGNNAVDPNGLLVRSTNSGDTTDHTFGWVPEIDLTIGWRKFPNYEVTLGYHVMAMTDALQVSGAMDANLAVNLANNPTGRQGPSNPFNYDTFYVQGIHFGLRYVY